MEDEVRSRPQRVVKLVESRLEEMAITWGELARRAGVSEETVRKFRRGMEISLPTKRSISQALGWAPDGFARIAKGESPMPVDDMPKGAAASGNDDIVTLWARITPEDRAHLRGIMERLAREAGG